MTKSGIAQAVGLAVVAVLAGTSCSPFVKVNGRSKPGEAKSNLKYLHLAEKVFCQEQDRFSDNLAEIGFAPERGNRYAYFIGGSAMELRDSQTPPTASRIDSIGVDRFKYGPTQRAITYSMLPTTFAGGAKLGLSDTCPKCDFVAAAAADLDGDPELDIWSIASFDRTAPDGALIHAGQPFCEYQDEEPPSRLRVLFGLW